MTVESNLRGSTNGKSKKNGQKLTEKYENKLVRREVLIVGRTSLLINRVTEEELEKVRTKAKPPKNAPRLSPREECEKKVYLHNDKPILPAQNILSCLIEAGRHVRLDGKRMISNAQSTTLPAFLLLEDPYVPLLNPHNNKAATWEVDMRGGRNPNGNQLVCICRPRFDEWSFKLNVQLDLGEIAEDSLRELFEKAASRVGLGDFRPQRKGMQGQFWVNAWKPLKNADVSV